MRQIQQAVPLMLHAILGITLFAVTSFAAGDECQTTHRDYEWEGYSHADITEFVHSLRKSPQPEAILQGKPPKYTFRHGSKIDATWVFDANRKFETIPCDGLPSTEVQWEFAIARVSWEGGIISECHLYRKSFITEGGRPDPFLEVSPFDSFSTCEEFLRKAQENE